MDDVLCFPGVLCKSKKNGITENPHHQWFGGRKCSHFSALDDLFLRCFHSWGVFPARLHHCLSVGWETRWEQRPPWKVDSSCGWSATSMVAKKADVPTITKNNTAVKWVVTYSRWVVDLNHSHKCKCEIQVDSPIFINFPTTVAVDSCCW